MRFSIDRRHWAVFILLFLVNLIALVLKAPFQSGIEVRVLLLMVACSAAISFIVAWLLVTLFDRMSGSRQPK
jgi:hypothetical protein